MSLTLRQFLEARRTTGADWNITGLRGTPDQNNWVGKYVVSDDDYEQFLALAHDHVFTRGRTHSLLERQPAHSPPLIDLDFRYTAGGPLSRRITVEQLREFVAAWADAFARFFEPSPTADPLQFFVMLKPAPEADPKHDAHKDGAHIECTNLSLPADIKYAIRGYLLQTGAVERIFGATGHTNSATDCYDISTVARNNWFVYGACKPDKAYYEVVAAYTVRVPESYDEPLTADSLEALPADAFSPEELVPMLSVRRGHTGAATELTLRTADPATELEWQQLLKRWGGGSNWAPRKSPGFFGAAAAPGAGAPPGAFSLDEPTPAAGGAGASSAAADMIQLSGMSVRAGYSTEDIAVAYKLVRECLNPTRRARGYADWVNLGLLLHNIAPGEESYRVWAEFSRRAPGCASTPEAIYRDKWAALPAEASAVKNGRKPLMMGTLHLWAREDSEASYRTIMAEANKEMALLNDSGSHVSVAELVVRMYRHEFRCTPERGTSLASMIWYQFTNHAWKRLLTNTRVRERLSGEVRNMYIQADRDVGLRITQATVEDERQRLEAKRKNLLKVQGSLNSCGFKDSAMREVAEKFYDEEFIQNLNMETTLVGFSNGVLELRKAGSDGQHHVAFRPGRPDDCISFQMGRGSGGLEAIPYIPYDPAAPAPEHMELLDFFTKIYPDPVLREYALTLYAACLEGKNTEQKFYIMSGSGGNGKSKIIDLMSKTFGEYQESLPVTAITRKRADAGAANPELIVLKNRRFISMVEPEEGEKINTSLMKQLSGEDTLKARGLFKDQDAFVVTARIFMSCNNLPPVSSMDNGTWRRLRVIPHVAEFVEAGKPTNPAANIHPRDPLLDVKIMRWRPYFAGLLVWYFENRYLRSGLAEPKCVSSASDRYKEENDSFAAFCQECLVRELGAELSTNAALGRYKEWSKFAPAAKQITRKDMITRLTELYGKPVDAAGKMFAGVRLAMEDEDVSGGVAV